MENFAQRLVSESPDSDKFKGRLRKGLDARKALLWNLTRLKAYTVVVENFSPEYDAWKSREKDEILKNIIRSQYELAWCDKNCDNLYVEPPVKGDRIMEHVIPVEIWKNQINSHSAHRETLWFLAWIGPVANISKFSATNIQEKNNNSKYFLTPFRRMSDKNIKIVNAEGYSVGEWSIFEHYQYIRREKFVHDLFEIAREKIDGFEKSLEYCFNLWTQEKV